MGGAFASYPSLLLAKDPGGKAQQLVTDCQVGSEAKYMLSSCRFLSQCWLHCGVSCKSYGWQGNSLHEVRRKFSSTWHNWLVLILTSRFWPSQCILDIFKHTQLWKEGFLVTIIIIKVKAWLHAKSMSPVQSTFLFQGTYNVLHKNWFYLQTNSV